MASAADAIIDLYCRHADEWDARRERSLLEQPWLDRFIALLPQPARVLDLGCGAGEPLAGHLIASGNRVTGIDASPRLIELCKRRFPKEEWFIADMRRLSMNRRFQGLLAWDSFFHLCPDDQRRMFPIFRRHAAPRAALMFTSGPSHGEAVGSFQGEPLYHGSLDQQEYRDLLDRNGFAVTAHAVEDPSCGHHTIWLAKMR